MSPSDRLTTRLLSLQAAPDKEKGGGDWVNYQVRVP